MKAGALDGLSIGFLTKRAIHDQKSGHRQLPEVDLFEISVVTFPMHDGARVASGKSADPAAIAAGLDRLMAVLRT